MLTKSFSCMKSEPPRPAGGWIYHYYPLPDENGEARWLRVSAGENEDRIYSLSVVDRFGWVEMLWDNPT